MSEAAPEYVEIETILIDPELIIDVIDEEFGAVIEVIEDSAEIVEVVEEGPPGPPGPLGPPGPEGGRYTHQQVEPAASWMITHGLGRRVSPTLFTDEDPSESVVTDVIYVDNNTIIVEWPSPTSGWAYI